MTQEQLEKAIELNEKRNELETLLRSIEKNFIHIEFMERLDRPYIYKAKYGVEDILETHQKAIISEVKELIQEIYKQIAEL